MSDIASDLRTHFAASLTAIADRTEAADRCIILSGGVDTCAILACAKELGVTFAAAITVITEESSPDRAFATAAAQEHSLPHHIVHVTSAALVDTYLPACVKLLATFDGMTLRNSLVVAAAMQRASELGFKHAVTGDGADELFGGYSFMWGMEGDPAGWKEKRDKMCEKWTFATAALGGAHGVSTHSPYTEPPFVAWAVGATRREHCIGVRPIRLVHEGEAIEHAVGKVGCPAAATCPPAASRHLLRKRPSSAATSASAAVTRHLRHHPRPRLCCRPATVTKHLWHHPRRPAALQVVLREAYATISSWRRKDPIEASRGLPRHA